MRGWTNDERMMIACCNDGTRPVIFKIERLDYKVVRLEQPEAGADSSRLKKALEDVPGVEYAQIRTDKSWLRYLSKRTRIRRMPRLLPRRMRQGIRLRELTEKGTE